MTDYITGKIAVLTPTQVVIDKSGIGYISEISLQTYQALDRKSEGCVFIQSQVNPRDGSQIDYGFATREERELFRLITGVSGMGAASARMMLSSLSSEELTEAILAEDVNRIKSVKGLGAKTAQRLILELKDKIVKGDANVSTTLFSTERNAIAEEAEAALLMLGFTKANVSKAIQKILKAKPDAKVEEIIKASLQML